MDERSTRDWRVLYLTVNTCSQPYRCSRNCPDCNKLSSNEYSVKGQADVDLFWNQVCMIWSTLASPTLVALGYIPWVHKKLSEGA